MAIAPELTPFKGIKKTPQAFFYRLWGGVNSQNQI